jgi:acyl-coenzyme A synthetase/AMP-(fatty) acid ligase
MERFDPLATLELIERHRVTHVQFVPTMMRRLLRLPEADRRRFDLSSLRTVIHAAAPQEIENVLAMHPAVFDATVIGLPDEEMGQRVVAVVQAEPGVAAGPGMTEELLAHCRAHLAGFKCPRDLVLVAELPRLPSGKLLRRRVRDWFDSGVLRRDA